MTGQEAAPGTAAALGGMFFVFLVIYVAIAAVMLWSYGTLLKAATGDSKVMVLLLLVPLVNLVMPIVWGVKAHQILLEREGKMMKPAA